jgi:hypothetical protein
MASSAHLRRRAQRLLQQARIRYLRRWMLSANPLTRAVTAAILDARGLLPELAARRRPRTLTDPPQEARNAG